VSDTPPDRTQALKESEAAANEDFDRSSASGAVQSCHEDTTWIDIKLVDENNEPIPGARFQILRPDGTLLGERFLGEDGCGGFENIDDLDYRVCFPDLDQEAWDPQT